MPSHKPTGKRRWVPGPPPKSPKPPIPAALKAEVTRRAQELVETVLKPRYVLPPSPEAQLNYVIDVFTHWYHSYLYFCATYCCPGPDALSPSFEARFARFTYIGQERFDLAFMRHTGEWITLYEGNTLDECLDSVRDDPFFML